MKMKKVFKTLLLLPILLVAFCFLFACGEDSVASVYISFPTSSYEAIEDRGRFYLEYSSDPIPLEVQIAPAKFSPQNITWITSNSTIAYVNNAGKLIMTSDGEGAIDIQAQYTNENGSIVYSNLLRFYISLEKLPEFPRLQDTITYNGTDQKNSPKCIVRYDKPGTYEYIYYYIGEGSTSQEVESIMDAGEYLVTYVKSSSKTKFAEMRLIVNKYEIERTAPNTTSVFGEPVPAGFFSTTPTTEDYNNGANLTGGVGKDAGKVLGKYLHITSANSLSNTGTQYKTDVVCQFNTEYAKNYLLRSISGLHTITQKQLVVKIKDQTITYGSAPTPNFFVIYDYNSYVSNNYSISSPEVLTPITDENYIKRVNISAYIYMYGNTIKTNNEWNYLDSGSYTLTADIRTLAKDNNVNTRVCSSGSLSVQQMNITVLPNALNGKFYTEPDDYSNLRYSVVSGSIPNNNEINPFLTISYNDTNGDYGEGNYKALVGSYYYSVNNSVNKNFVISLAQQASENYSGTDAVKFNVFKCPVSVRFDDIVEYYEIPNGMDASNNQIHTVSYYSIMSNNSVPNYILDSILSFKVNGEERVVDGVLSCKAENFNNNGNFEIETGDSIKFSLKLNRQTTTGSHFAVYSVGLQSVANETQNFEITVETSYVFLDKINVTVTPRLTIDRSTKTYSADSRISSGFYTDYDTSNNMEAGVTVSMIFGVDMLLSLTDSNGKYHLKVEGASQGNQYMPVDSMVNCGEYKIFLSSGLSYLPSKEYYDFALDSTTNYHFIVYKQDIFIIPNDVTKTYGDADPVLSYSYGNSIPNLQVTGSLRRNPGENVGNYGINLGDLSFGPNYSLQLISTDKKLTITPRSLTIYPISYVTTFGDDYPESIGYNDPLKDQSYNSNILVRPTFSGVFALYHNNIQVPKVGRYYPVTLISGVEQAYQIKADTFHCESANYVITVDESSTYLVKRRKVTLNIITENKQSADDVTNPIVGFENYTLNSDEGKEDVSLSGLNFTAAYNEVEGKYYIQNLGDISSLIVTKESTVITDCYDISLGQNVVYYIASVFINISIVSTTNDSTSLVRTVYNGTEVTNVFKVICNTEGYEIDPSSNPIITYTTTTSSNATPLNAGSYYVSLSINASNKIIINRQNGTNIEFTQLNSKQNNYVLNLAQHGYLNIEKAEISYVSGALAFENPIIFGNDETTLSNIKTTYDDSGTERNVFSGVSDSALSLKEYASGNNFVFVSAPQSMRTLNASVTTTYSIKVVVEALKSGSTIEVDTNYKPLSLDVPLYVTPREIEINTTTSTFGYKDDPNLKSIAYSGRASVFYLDLKTTPETAQYSTVYTYQCIETTYDESKKGAAKLYDYSGGVVTESTNTLAIELLTIDTIEEVNYQGDKYYLVNKNTAQEYCVKIVNQDATPRDACIYLCIAICTTGDNYVFKDGKTKNMRFYVFFEIEKSDDIHITDWQNEFRYGTIFDLRYPSALPFSYNITPDFRGKVIYATPDESDWASDNYVLEVSANYSINLSIDDNNYYYSAPQSFSVISREAQILFPNRTKYGYKGENERVELFLADILAILKDQSGNPIYEKSYANFPDEFTLRYFTQTGTDLGIDAPWSVGNYTLSVAYGNTTSQYFGEGEFSYSIEAQAFTGMVAFINAEIEYDPSANADVLYQTIVGSMFAIELGTVYSLVVRTESGVVISPSDNSWVSSVNIVAVNKINFTVSFPEDETIADYVGSANLTVIARKVRTSNFTIPSEDSQYQYTGNAFYNGLKFSTTVDLTPGTVGGTRSFLVGNTTYYVFTSSYNIVTLKDNLQNSIFTLAYNYSYENSAGSNNFILLNSAPINSKLVRYRVEYVFSNFGANYSNRLEYSTITRHFKINKVSTLYISIFDDADSEYDTSIVREFGGNESNNFIYNYFTEEFIVSRLNNIISVSNSREIKDNIKKKIILTSTSKTYDVLSGVHIVVFFTDEVGNITENLKDAGTYYMNISFLKNSNYVISDFFDFVVFNANTSFSTLIDLDPSNPSYRDGNAISYSYIYDAVFSIPFIIEQKECPFDETTFAGAITMQSGSFTIVEETRGLFTFKILEFTADTLFSLKQNIPFTLVIKRIEQGVYQEIFDDDYADFYNQGQYYFTNLSPGVEFALMLVDPSGNHYSSNHILFRVLSP